MPDVITCLLTLLENPDAEKAYVDLKKYYDSVGMEPESLAIEHLIKEKFHVVSNSSTSQKQ
jgi:hypothetical protein